ncbi:hypothetical protein H0H81_012364 [Sphagnurus paluster]|uniref:Acyl-protein thioesterase 1 n=1 Tax=Sphagnurus paluster TaxID=117069 RepID=A0A9P7GQH7_9AGAR|nr:hypothetical protein H0H81_012364 [Sphagnurus paluster]
MSQIQAENEGLKIPYELIVREPTEKHTATVIWLHGLGDSAEGMLPMVDVLRGFSGVEHVKIIMPTANRMAVIGAFGEVMNSWFNCFSFEYETRKEDEAGLLLAADLLNDVVKKEQTDYGIPPHRIAIGGISQGSAASIFIALTTPTPLAGLFVMAGYVPLRHRVKEFATPHASSLPIFWGHGAKDPRLQIPFTKATAKQLAVDLGVPFFLSNEAGQLDPSDITAGKGEVRLIIYDDLGHWMSELEMVDLHAWLGKVLPKEETDKDSTTAANVN